jgi:PAS domain S-box-containing protein
MKIANKISLSFLLTAVVLTSIAAPVFYITARKSLQDRIYAHLETTVRSRAHHIETYLKEHKGKVEIMADSAVVENAIEAFQNKESGSTELTKEAGLVVAEFIQTEEDFYEIFVLNRDGKIVSSTDQSSIGLDRSTDTYFLGAREVSYIKDAYYSTTTKRRSIAISAPVLDDETGQWLGVLVARSDLMGLSNIACDRTGLGKTGEIFIVNKEGYMITPSRFREDTFLKQKVDIVNVDHNLLQKDKKLVSRKHELYPFRSYRGAMVLGTHAYIPQMQWYLCSEIDKKEALASLVIIRLVFVFIMTLVPVGAWLIGVFLSRVISRPIRKLQVGAEIIGRGNLDYKVAMDTRDEIGQLSRTFDKMCMDLKESNANLKNSHKQLEKKVQERTVELSSTNKRLQEEIEQRSETHTKLRQHIKELQCLYGLSRLIEKQKIPLEEILQETPDLIRNAYHSPDIISVRITCEGIQYKTDNFRKSRFRQFAPINVRGEKTGEIEVYWLGEETESGQTPFLQEERSMLDAVAVRLGRTAERKKAAETLRLFRDLIDRSNDSIFVIEPEWGRFLDVNDRACESLGYTREELLTMVVKNVDQSIPDDSTWQKQANKLKSRADLVIQGEHRRKNGTTFCVETSLNLVKHETKDYIIAAARDITERKQAEEALKESEAKYRSLLVNIPDVVWTSDEKGNTIFISDNITSIYGYNPEEICKEGYKLWFGSVHPDDVERVKDSYKAVFKKGQQLDLEYRIRRKDGEWIWIQDRSIGAYTKDGVRYADGVLFDITERKRAEDELRGSEQRLKTILDSILTGVLIIDAGSHIIIDANPIAEAMIGLPKEDIVGNVCHEFTCSAEKGKCPITDLGHIVDGSEHVLVRPNGSEIPILKTVTAMRVHGHDYLVESFVDITDRKLAEIEQAELLEEVESVNRELKDFAYIVSHDLKAPLRGIKTLTDWLACDYADKLDDSGREQMDMLLNRVQRMHDLIDGVLQYSRIGRIKEEKVKVNLNDLVAEVIDTVAPPKNIEFTVENELPEIECEETRMIQIFQNLLSNAVKYMDKPQGRIRIGCVEEDGFWKFSVADNGPGIEEKHFERVFRIFQTLSPRDGYESTGIGLTVVKKIVELYGGNIWIESKLGKGSTFFFTLPKQEIEMAGKQAALLGTVGELSNG